MDLPKPVLVAAGGIAGAGVRWLVLHLADDAPWALLAVNAVGCFLLALVVEASPEGRLFVGIGFCGALTTFSTLAVDIASDLDTGAPGAAAGTLTASLVTGVAAGIVGLVWGRRAT